MSRKNKIIHGLLVVGCWFLIALVRPMSAEAAAPSKDPIIVNGDKVEYLQESKEVVGSGNVIITYKDVVLTCDKVTVDLNKREAVAQGGVRISQDGSFFTGENILYNFDSRQGKVADGYLSAPPYYGRTAELEKVAYKDEVVMRNGYVTTCDLEKPHYRLQAGYVIVYFGDKIIAKHMVFYVGDVPVFYLPYYVHSLKDTKSHITIIPGEDSDWGYYALGAYRYYLNDVNRGDILLDYRSKKGLGAGINHYYTFNEIGEGAAKIYYSLEGPLAYEKPDQERTRYRYQLRHRWDMGEESRTVATVELNKLSDKDVIKDYFYKEYEELNDPENYNYVSIVTATRDFTTEFLMRKRFDKFFTVVERLPEYKMKFINRRIGKTGFYYNGETSGAYLNKTYEKTVPEQKDVNAIRVDSYNQLSYAARFFKTLSVTPYAGIRETYYSRNKWGDTNLDRTVFNFGIDNSIKFYRVYDVESDFLGLDIHKIRHIVTPTANYYYTHQPTIAADNLNQFDEIDALESENGIRLGIENKLQTKRGDGKHMTSVDLATLIISTDYMFRLEKNNTSLKSNKFKSVDFQLELVPYSWMYMLSKLSVNPKKPDVSTASIDLVLNGGEKWNFALGNRYENSEDYQSNLMSLDGTYKINDKWKVRAYERFDLWTKKFEEQEYTIYRDLHCWVAEFIVGVKDPSDYTFWLVLRLKAFPEYPIGMKRTISHPRFGSTSDQEAVD